MLPLANCRFVSSDIATWILQSGGGGGGGGAEETTEDFCVRYARNIKQVMTKYGCERWDAMYHRLYFTWAGRVRRLRLTEPQRLTYQVLRYKDWQWIQNVADANSGSQQHHRKLRAWRWERSLYKFFDRKSETWGEAAEDEKKWVSFLDKMVDHRCIVR